LGSNICNISYRNQGRQEIETVLSSFSGQKIAQTFNKTKWSIDYQDSKGSYITKTITVCTITSPQIYSKVNLTYVREIGGTVNGSYETTGGHSATFKLVGVNSGTTYKTGENVSSLELTDIEEPVKVVVTWKAKISSSEYYGSFYMTNVTATVK